MHSDVNIDPFLEAIERITAFEGNGAAIKWSYRGFHVWPIVKYVLVKQMIAAMNRGYTPTDRFKTYPNFAKKMQRPTGLSAMFAKSVDRTRSIALLPSGLLASHSYWCFGSGSGFYDLNGLKVSQHHHALRSALFQRGQPSLGLYSGFDADELPAMVEYGPQVSLDKFIHSVGLTAQVPHLTSAFLRRHFKGLDAIIGATGHHEADLFAFADTLIGRVDYTIACFAPIFRKTPPKVVFTSNYASFYGWALAQLCRRHGIAFVDIQHGIQGQFNGAYYFDRTPKADWSILPTAQLCWSESDAVMFKKPHSKRKAAVVGPTWSQFVGFLPKQPESVLRSISIYRAQGELLLLFAGQQAEDILVAKHLREAGINILFRGHPTQQGEAEKLVDATEVAALGCELAAKTPLPVLLDAVDGVVTGYSAVILEAGLKGVPSLATGAFASLLAQDYATELDGLLTVKPTKGVNEKVSVILDWARGITRDKRCHETNMPPIADALGDLDITL